MLLNHSLIFSLKNRSLVFELADDNLGSCIVDV